MQLKEALARAGSLDRQLQMLAPVQRAEGGEDPGQVHAAAAEGVAGSGGSLPHLDRIQRAFGHHDVSDVQAHTDVNAVQASASIGAEAYATGNHVAFGQAPDLHTAAHEAAHIVQQKSGVSLAGGVGSTGDRYEQHADKVADAVVAGKSAEPVLSEMAGGSASGEGEVQQKAAPGGVVQRRAWYGTNKETSATFIMPPGGLAEQDRQALAAKNMMTATAPFQDTWTQVWTAICEQLSVNPEMAREGIEAETRTKLESWVNERSATENAGYARPEGPLQSPERAAAAQAASTAPTTPAPVGAAETPTPTTTPPSGGGAETPAPGPVQSAHTEQRVYPELRQMATALIHESHPEYDDRVKLETELAIKVAGDAQYGGAVREIVAKLASTLTDQDMGALEKLAASSRYASFSSLGKCREICAGGGDVGAAIILIDEFNNYWPKKSEAYEACKQDMRKTFGDMRVNGYTVNEDNPWVQEARNLGMPLMAGPSGTTNGVLARGAALGLGGTTLYKVAWAMHAFFNGMWRGQSGTHRLHEVMAVAKAYCGSAFTYYPSMKEVG